MKRYLVIFEKTNTGYSAYVPDLPGCIATGITKFDAEKNIYEAIKFHLESFEFENDVIPSALCESEIMVFN